MQNAKGKERVHLWIPRPEASKYRLPGRIFNPSADAENYFLNFLTPGWPDIYMLLCILPVAIKCFVNARRSGSA
jgi:hypothetical protein